MINIFDERVINLNEIYDIAIIGTGPAGLSAAINATIRNKNIILFGQDILSNKIIKAQQIDNYLGFHNISGEEMKNKFSDHIKAMNIEIINKRVNNVYAMGEYFAINANNNIYEAKKVIIATGVEYLKPITGEINYLGKGVGYCATCDAPLYKQKIMTVIGYNIEAEIETNFISELAKKTYYIPMYEGDYKLKDNIEIIKDRPIEILGDEKVNKLLLKNSEIETDVVFVLKDSVSPNVLIPGVEMDNEHIKANRNMQTNIKNLYAAGDCIGKPYQYIKAAGEGLVAALHACTNE